ncbi:MAG: FAD/NAD(P)-binding protein, partial [Chloroflexia bacterium]
MSTPSSQTIIVGGGLAGLTASIYLARANRPVTLLEKADHVGGRAISQDHNGYIFNL